MWSYPPLSAEEKRVVTADQMEDDARARARDQVDDLLADPANADLDVTLSVEQGAPAKVLLAAARGSDLLVVGRRDHARIRHLLLGSIADQCIRHAPCPTMVVPHGDDDRGDGSGPIVVGVDGSDTSLHALDWALEEGSRLGRDVLGVYCWQERFPIAPEPVVAIPDLSSLEAGARADLEAWIARTDVPDGVTLSGDVRWGDPAEALLDGAASPALLVVGSRGRGGFTGLLLGSVSRRVVHLASCPVVVYPHREP